MQETRAAAATVANRYAPKKALTQRLGITLISGGMVQRGDLIMALALFLPGFIILVLLGTYPIFSVISLSLQQRSLFDTTGTWVGFANFEAILSSPVFWAALKNDLVFTAGSVLLQLVLGLAVALLLHQNFFGRNAFRSFLLFSYVLPTTVGALIWRFVLNDSVGIVYHSIRYFSLPIPNTWFSSTDTAMATVILFTVWKFFPFMVINFLAGLQTVDEQLYEAARVDGASKLQAFRHVTLPLLMPIIIIVLLLRTIWTFNNWEVVALLTNGGPLDATIVPPVLIHRTMFAEFSLGRAAALSVIMMVVLLAAMAVYLWFYHRTEERLR